MSTRNKLLALTLPLLLAIPSILAAKVTHNKQLAGPPSEFEFMQPASAEKSAITTKTALLPIKLQETMAGNWYWHSKLAVDSHDFSFMLLSNNASNWQIEMFNPVTKQLKNAEELASKQISSQYGMEGNNYPGKKYSFDNLTTGNWDISIKTIGEPEQFEGFILLSSHSKYLLNSYKTNSDQIVGHNIHFVAQSTSNEETIEVFKDYNPITSAFMLVTYPSGKQQKISMYDDGNHGDTLAGDGLYGGDFKAIEAGDYTVQVNAHGRNPNGTPFFRTGEHIVPVIEQKITMPNKAVHAYSINDNRLNISIGVNEKSPSSNDRYRIIAEVWGSSKSDNSMQAVSWISTITDVDKGQLNIELDGRWMAMAQVFGQLQLRNLRIEDADNFIPLISAKTTPMTIASLPKSAQKSFDGIITEEMMMGVRPSEKSINNKAVGGKLVLVHGYCSKNSWGSVTGQFSNSALFLDLHQNRTHDNFARRIANFGSQFRSFGLVSHSQGGAASLHLYTYYWSGLDRSTGSRLIQTVGTPYRGTPLAGNLAAIGNVFGQGCGKNNNLTPSGSAAWLAGIPTWARNRVNYYTTSFRDRRWRYDYCNIVTDLFLSDPDDGVIERSRGQLSGGLNRGHKTGWCHTVDMRDPGQTTDSSRNAVMNVLANR